MTRTPSPLPFTDDPEYLEAELRWLRCRVSRLLVQRRLADASEEEADGDPAFTQRPGRMDSRRLRCRIVELREQEAKLRREIDARLQINRGQRGAHTLGLDEICKEASLGAEERLVLLTALPFGISQTLAESVLQDLVARHWGAASVSDAIAVLDPKSVSDWLRYRALFRPGASLVQSGLIEVNSPGGSVGPDTLPCADFRLTLECAGRICGDPEMITEGD